MEALLTFALWAGFIFLMMRFACGAHVMGRGHERRAGERSDIDRVASATLRWVPPARDVDPVCGKAVETARAKSSVHDGDVFYFCSRECREAFEARPDIYLGKPNKLERHHAKDSIDV